MPAEPRPLKDLFVAAIELADPQARQAFLDRECVENPSLRQRLEALLAAHDRPDSAVAQPFVAGETGTFADPQLTQTNSDEPRGSTPRPTDDHLAGTVIAGKYKLLERIGEGGMGDVWMADQTEPVKRRVAVKLIKAGMDSKQVLARFEAERQALAMMDHPNIAKVLDGGVSEIRNAEFGTRNENQNPDSIPNSAFRIPNSVPYFVMELVKGVPITEYCDRHKLTPKQRLELFVPVCQAIQHAHQKGVIHRDIKPSNVLIAMYDDRPVPKVIDFGVAKATGQQLSEHTLNTGFGGIVGTPEYMSPEQASFNNMDIDTRSDVYSLGVLLYELLTGSTPVDRKSLGKAALLEILRIVREVEAPKPSAKLSTIDTLPNVAANRGTEPAKLSKLMRGELDWVVLKALEKDRTRRYDSSYGLARDIQRYLADEVVEARPPTAGYRLRKFVRRHKGQVIAASLVFFALFAGIAGTSTGLIRAQEQRRLAVAAQQAETERAEGERQAKQKAEIETKKARKQAEIAEAVKEFLERDLIAQVNPLDAGRGDSKPDPDLKLKTALDRAVPHIAKRFEGKPLIEASIRRAIGKAYLGRGLVSEAQTQLGKACELYRAELANTERDDVETLVRHPYVEAMIELINLYSSQGQTQKALAAIPMLEDQLRRSFGDVPEAKTILEMMAGLREILEGKDPTKALAKNRELLRKVFGEKSSEQPPSSRTPEMKSQTEKVRAAEEGVMGTIQQMENFTAAMKLMNQGKYPEAENALKQMIEPRRAKGEVDVLITIPMLAEVYRLQGKFAEARANYESARDGIRKALGEDHPSLGACHYGLAHTFLSEKKYDQAEIEIRAALAFYEKRMPDDLIRFELKGMFGAALVGQKKYAAAEPLLLAVYEGWTRQEKSFPQQGSTRIPEALDRLIELSTAMEKPDEVKKWQAERAKYGREVIPMPAEKK